MLTEPDYSIVITAGANPGVKKAPACFRRSPIDEDGPLPKDRASRSAVPTPLSMP